MVSTDVWGLIHAERKALATDLQALTDAQWATPSLCTDWTVRDVLAHMTATARMTPPQFIGKFVLSGVNFASVPGPNDTWLGEVIVHSEDIRRALGIRHAYPTDAAVQVANFYKNSNLLIGAKTRISGLKLRATDADWSTGEGPEVSGPIVSLVLAMTGRTGALDDLTGDGVARLRQSK